MKKKLSSRQPIQLQQTKLSEPPYVQPGNTKVRLMRTVPRPGHARWASTGQDALPLDPPPRGLGRHEADRSRTCDALPSPTRQTTSVFRQKGERNLCSVELNLCGVMFFASLLIHNKSFSRGLSVIEIYRKMS